MYIYKVSTVLVSFTKKPKDYFTLGLVSPGPLQLGYQKAVWERTSSWQSNSALKR